MENTELAWPAILRPGLSSGRSVFFAVVLVVGLLYVAARPAVSAEAEAVTLSGTYSDQQFVAGEEVHINAAVSDEIFAAGGEITFDGASARTIIAAGHGLTVQGSTAQDVIMAGGGLEFAADVADDLVAAICPFCPFASNRLHIRDSATIGDDARLATRILDIDGTIGGDLYAVAGDFTLTGEVAGNVEILAERIVLAPGARIGGNFSYRSRTEPEIADGAVIGGAIAELDAAWFDEVDFERNGVGFWSWVVFVLALIVFGAVVQLVAPGLLAATGAMARERTWSSLGIGFLVLVVTPVAAGLLFVSVIGIPLGLFALTLLAVAAGLALATVALAIGSRIRRTAGVSSEATTTLAKMLWLAAGMIVLALISAIPFIGGLIFLVVLLVGLGAVYRQVLRLLRAPPMAGATA